MKILKKLLSLALAAVLFACPLSALAVSPSPSATAEPDGTPAPEAAGTAEAADAADTTGTADTADAAGESVTVLDPAELEKLLADFTAERGLDESNFSLAYCYTGTGETWYYNGDTYFEGASLYKLPLMMGVARLVSEGQLAQEDELYGMSVSYIEKMAITYSDNEISETMIGYFTPFKAYRAMLAELAGIPAEELPSNYNSSNVFSARFMLGVLQNLYENPDTFPNILECMLDAQPEHFFRLNLEGVYDVAQKYGSADGNMHTAGIIYTPTPCLLTVMTHNASSAEYVIGDAAKMLADYTLTLDGRLAERQAEAEARAKEEAQAEAEARAEEEAQEAARQAEEEKAAAEARAQAEAEAAQAAEAQAQLAARTQAQAQDARNAVIMRASLGVLVFVLAALVCLYAVGKYRKARQRR